MTAAIIPFDFEEQSVRVVVRDGASWWVAADVCRVLEIANSRDALSRLDDDERQEINPLDLGVGNTDVQVRQHGGARRMSLINESGLYALILTSRKPAAKRFRKWVTAEVLPALRTRGRYELPAAEDKREISTERLLELLQSENELLRSKVRAERPKRKPSHPMTDAERTEILRLVRAGLSLAQISRLTGRSTSAISLMRSGLRVIEGGE